VELLLSRYLEEAYSANSYAVNVYVVPGPQAIRLGRFSREDLENKKFLVDQFFGDREVRLVVEFRSSTGRIVERARGQAF